MSVLIAIAAFVVALGILVTVHEYGHYRVARWCGVRVLRFSVGFGKPIWRRMGKDGVEYVVAAIPLGGYVRMLDERDPDAPPGVDMRESFTQATPLRKIAITVAGPAANFLFAVAAYWAMFVVGIPGLMPVVGHVVPDTPAAVAGVEAGDRIVAVEGSETPTWEAAMLGLLEGVITGRPFAVTVAGPDGATRELSLEAGAPRALTEPGALLPGLGIEPWRPRLPPVLERVQDGSAAADAGLRDGDLIVAVDGEPVPEWMDLVTRIQARPGETATFTVERDGRRFDTEVTIGAVDAGERLVGRIGAAVHVPDGLYEGMRAELRHGPLAAIGHGAARTVEMSVLTVKMLVRMVVGDVSVKNISGPINIAQYAGYTASIGIVPFLAFLAIVSISLGIINLLPIPILDGGHLVYHLYELVRGHPVSEHAEAIGQRIGLGMLAMLMGLAIYNDLVRILG